MLLLLTLAAYLPGLFTIPPIDRDESRFAQASRQMFESVMMSGAERSATGDVGRTGGLAIPYVQDRPRLNKPPLIYWLQAMSAAIFTGGRPMGDEIWMYRIPGVLCAIGAVVATWRLALTMCAGMGGVGTQARLIAFVGAGALAICPVVIIDAHQARADQLLLLTVVLTQWTLWKIAQGDGRLRIAALLWVCIGLGVLSKGPITPMIAGLTALAWSFMRREWRWLSRLRPVVGAAIVGIMVAPWVYAVAERIGFENYWRTIWGETIGRSAEAKEGHWGPPGYHLLLAFFLLWPVSLGIPGAIAGFWRARRTESAEGIRAGFREGLRRASVSRPADAFLLAWIVPSWIVFEFVSTKLPHYTLPLFPALCILGGAWLVRAASSRSSAPAGVFLHFTRFWFGTGFVVLAAIGALTLSLSWWEAIGWWRTSAPGDLAPRTNWFLTVPIVAMLALMVFSGRELARMRTVESLGLAACAVVFGFGLLLGAVAPHALSLTSRIVRAAASESPGSGPALDGFYEDSIIFLTRGTAVRGGVERGPGQVAIVAESTNPAPDVRARALLFRGLNIAKGRCETVLVVKPDPGRETRFQPANERIEGDERR